MRGSCVSQVGAVSSTVRDLVVGGATFPPSDVCLTVSTRVPLVLALCFSQSAEPDPYQPRRGGLRVQRPQHDYDDGARVWLLFPAPPPPSPTTSPPPPTHHPSLLRRPLGPMHALLPLFPHWNGCGIQFVIGGLARDHGYVKPSDFIPQCSGYASSEGLTRECYYEAYVRLHVFGAMGMTKSGVGLYVCMYVCMHVWLYVCMYVCSGHLFVCMGVAMCALAPAS
jgi:hypothetical protein